MKTRVVIALLLAAAAVIVVACFLSRRGTGERQEEVPADVRAVADAGKVRPRQAKKQGVAATQGKTVRVKKEGGGKVTDVPQQAEGDEGESRADGLQDAAKDAAEKLVAAFDSLTDRWIKPVKGGISMKDVEAFAEQFRKVPNDRKKECLHRALNLVPDENVMLLAGILMDKSQDKEYVELVFNDVLNRDEEVKKPILQQIFKDKEHPCWVDAAWILDVTGERPRKVK